MYLILALTWTKPQLFSLLFNSKGKWGMEVTKVTLVRCSRDLIFSWRVIWLSTCWIEGIPGDWHLCQQAQQEGTGSTVQSAGDQDAATSSRRGRSAHAYILDSFWLGVFFVCLFSFLFFRCCCHSLAIFNFRSFSLWTWTCNNFPRDI